jgi:hypothetical protein
MDWKKITNHLYENIKPIDGRIHSYINDSYNSGIQFSDFWIEFDMNEFNYVDPFYGESKSTDPFNMNVDLLNVASQYNIQEINEFEKLTFENSENGFYGAFSNSLHVVPKFLKFGEIKGDRIEFEMSYSLTNSDSYGMMNGTLEEHMKLSGTIKIPLKICELIVRTHNKTNLRNIISNLNSNIYDLESIKCIRESNEYEPEEDHIICYKNIMPLG